jgi:hypothetical protein
MVSLLESLGHGVLELPYLIDGILVEILNGAIVALATLAAAAFEVLPAFPTVGSLPGGVLSGMEWFFPFGAIAAVVTAMVTAYVTFLGVKVVLKKVGAL